MNFLEAINICLSKYATFSGRASRREFWYFTLFVVIILFISGFMAGFMDVSDDAFDIALLVIIIPIFLPSIAVAARRLHDMNQSGWWQCIFIPGFYADDILGTGFIIYTATFILYAFWFSRPGDVDKNRFDT
jgi:uncharacterized membrane protein YhaH (DUF805 family)